MTSLRIDSPNNRRAASTGTGPTPAISHSSSPSVWPRHELCLILLSLNGFQVGFSH
jgi:hypothetical protein